MRTPAEILKAGLTEEERGRYQVTVGNWYEDAHRNLLHGPCRHSCQEVLDAIRAIIEAYRPPGQNCESCPGFGLMATHGYGVEVVEEGK